MEEEKIQEELKKIQIEATKKLKLADTLRDAVKFEGEAKLNALLYSEDKETADIFNKHVNEFAEFSKDIANHLAEL